MGREYNQGVMVEERIKELEAEVHALNSVLFTAVAWLGKEFGEAGVNQLSEIYENEKERKLNGIV